MDGHAGGVYCQEFSFYILIGAEGTAFKVEVKAIEVPPLNLIPRVCNFNRAVIITDFKASIQAVASNITPKAKQKHIFQ